MSNMKNGFSTLNRWLGKRNKDKDGAPNGKLSKSNTNLSLSISTTNINDTSQLEYNRITPLPAATSNAPFEQTFRITVQLPKDQLYVSRLGARVPLSKLLELVCEHKLLDANKYEFRNPVDPSQVYSCDLTIGAVGLSEIRLCHKSEPYDNFNADEVIKLHRTPVIRDSLSSSEFSSRNSKHTAKTTSPYSSSNSLNSMDSTGMNYTRTPVTPPATLTTQTTTVAATKMLAPPPRKKRAAPRPPSQLVIPEKSALVIENHHDSAAEEVKLREPQNAMSRKDYCLSTPNLSTSTLLANNISGIDCNGNSKQEQSNDHDHELSDHTEAVEPSQLTVEQKNARNLYTGSVQNLSRVQTSEHTQRLPEPSPRKRLIQMKKKIAAPAPPPRGSSLYMDDNISYSSNATCTPPSTPLTPATPDLHVEQEIITYERSAEKMNATKLSPKNVDMPKPHARETTQIANVTKTTTLHQSTPVLESESVLHVETIATAKTETPTTATPKPVPRSTTTTLLNAESMTSPTTTPTTTNATNMNISKVMLNRTPTPEPRSLSSETELDTHLTELNNCEDDDNVSKQADSGIGEPIPSPIPDSLPSEGSAHECKSTFESSSDDDDMIKVYNFKLGKTIIKPVGEPETLEDLRALTAQTDSGEMTPATATATPTPNGLTETSTWNFSIPISPPPNFADSKFSEQLEEQEKAPDTPITPKIKERPVLNFDALTKESAARKTVDVVDRGCSVEKQTTEVQLMRQETKQERVQKVEQLRQTTPVPASPTKPLNEIVDELSAIINEKRIDTLIKKAENNSEIESAKPNTLSNFSITTITQQTTNSNKPHEILTNGYSSPGTPDSAHDEERMYRKRCSITKQRQSITRADSFHTTALQSPHTSPKGGKHGTRETQENGLNSRSSSYLSLTKLEGGPNLSRRRSSSELSIGESPSLQSLEVIKTILNSRKNSLANSSDGETAAKQNAIESSNVNEEQQTARTVKSNTDETQSTTTTATLEFKPKIGELVHSSADKVETITEKPKELPKVYRYSGPPSINFATWSERPKAQVAIKNEGDYIFGGRNANSQQNAAAVTRTTVNVNAETVPRTNYRASTATGNFFKFDKAAEGQQSSIVQEILKPTAPAVAPKPATSPKSPTMRMGIPEKNFHVPVTVKPLHDVTVESVTLRQNHNTHTQEVTTGITTKVMLNGDSTHIGTADNRRTYTQQHTTNATHTSTLPRVSGGGGGNRFSMAATTTTTVSATLPGPGLLRSTSITQLEANKPKSTAFADETAVSAPFGQNTLRKTGLKEKILAKEEQAKKNAINASNNRNSNAAVAASATLTNGNAATTTPTKTLQSARLELKLQKPAASNSNFETPQSYTQHRSLPTPKTAVIAPPPPPPATNLLKVTKSQNSSATTTPTSPLDSRDQLLDAIRNFKREGLNRT